MKNETVQLKYFFNFKLKPLCESILKSLLLPFLWLQHGVFGPARKKLLSPRYALALREVTAGLSAITSTLLVNNRIFVGLGLMGVIAPSSACVYLLFDRTVENVNWYHLNYFHLFFLLGPHLFELFCLLGVFLLFPRSSKRSYLLSVPTGYVISKIIWLILVTSNQEFWSVVPASFFVMGVLISFALFLTLDWLTWRKFHRVDAFEKRLELIFANGDDFGPAKAWSMFKTTWREKKSFSKEF
jgi:hypothetical protein